MNGKEILLAALKSQPTPRVPWVPFVGVHGGSLIDVDATTYLKSSDAIVAGLMEAARRYRPDGLPVVFDLQLEAEILGCDLSWAQETPPSVSSHPLDENYAIEKLPSFDIGKGRMPIILDAVRTCQANLGKEIALYGLLTGPLTLALHLRGDDLLLDLFDEEPDVVLLLDYCAGVAEKMIAAYQSAGIDVIAVVDPMVSQIGPEHFEQFVSPALNRIFDYSRSLDLPSSLFVCGNATRNLEVMARTTCDNLSIDENVDLAQLAKTCRPAGKSFGGNLQLTVVLLLGNPDDARRNAVQCMDLAGEGPGYILAPGCDLPYSVPPENIAAVGEVVHDSYQQEIARRLPPSVNDDDFADIEIPDYATESDVIVDVVTLDSAGCAPCAYMLTAAQEAARASEISVKVKEHKITGRDGLGYMKKLGVTAIPSICVDGKEVYASIIPARTELVGAFATAQAEKRGG